MSDIQLESGKIEKILKNSFYGLWLTWRPEYVPRSYRCGCVLWRYIQNYMGTSWGRQTFFGVSSGRPRDVILPSEAIAIIISIKNLKDNQRSGIKKWVKGKNGVLQKSFSKKLYKKYLHCLGLTGCNWSTYVPV